MWNETIVYLLRKTHLTLREIGALTPRQFVEIVNEVQRQESQEEYNKNYRTASLMAAIYNTIPRKGHRIFSAKDFLLEQSIGKSQSRLDKMAEDKGIKLPSKIKE